MVSATETIQRKAAEYVREGLPQSDARAMAEADYYASRKFVVKDDAVYLTDNGAALCGAHLGMTARYSGRDISGQPVRLVTAAMVALITTLIVCERCGRKAGQHGR